MEATEVTEGDVTFFILGRCRTCKGTGTVKRRLSGHARKVRCPDCKDGLEKQQIGPARAAEVLHPHFKALERAEKERMEAGGFCGDPPMPVA